MSGGVPFSLLAAIATNETFKKVYDLTVKNSLKDAKFMDRQIIFRLNYEDKGKRIKFRKCCLNDSALSLS